MVSDPLASLRRTNRAQEGRRRTFLAVRLPVLHMEEAVTEGFAAGGAHKASGVPRLPQSVHHFLPGETATSQRRQAQESNFGGAHPETGFFSVSNSG